MHRIVILGVGTEIGKTWVATSLARSAPPRTCIALKPIETGCASNTPAPDAALLAEAAGHPHVQPLYALPEPVTPWLAAQHAGTSIALPADADWVADHETATHATTSRVTTCIVETAGGVFSPIAEHITNLDLAARLDPALWVLVAPNRLGVLHDVTATITALRALARPPDALVLNHRTATDASTGTNASLLRRLHPEIPVLEASTLEPPTLAALARAVAGS